MQALTFFFAFVAVLVLIGVVAWLVRRFAGNRLGGNANRGRMPRLAVIDAAAVDGRRRLVLVRRDNVEHLLMIGGPTDIVVEPNIVRATPSRDQISPRPSMGTELPRGAPLPDAGWTEDEAPRLEMPEPAPPPPVPTRPARPSFADELRRAPPPPPEHRHDPLATIAAEPVTRPEPRPDLRAEPPMPRPNGRNEPQMPRAPLPPLRPSEPVAKVPPVRTVEPTAPAPLPAAQASSADQNLAEMAKRLEAALRRPGGERPTVPEPRVAAPAATPEPTPARPAPRINVNAPASNPAEPSAAPPVAAPTPTPRGDFENLEDEMASLLGRPKTPS